MIEKRQIEIKKQNQSPAETTLFSKTPYSLIEFEKFSKEMKICKGKNFFHVENFLFIKQIFEK